MEEGRKHGGVPHAKTSTLRIRSFVSNMVSGPDNAHESVEKKVPTKQILVRMFHASILRTFMGKSVVGFGELFLLP